MVYRELGVVDLLQCDTEPVNYISRQNTVVKIVEIFLVLYTPNVNLIIEFLDTVIQLVRLAYAQKDTHKYENELIIDI